MYRSSSWQQEEVKTQLPDGLFDFFFNYQSKVTGDPQPLNLFSQRLLYSEAGKN